MRSSAGAVGGRMSSALKCANPNCPYLFDPSRVPAGVLLCCPRCGMRFTLATPSPATTVATPQPPGGFPAAPPQPSPTLTFEEPTAPATPAAAEPVSRPLVRPDFTRVRSNKLQTVLLTALSAAVLAGAAAAVYFSLGGRDHGSAPAFDLRAVNLVFDPPGGPWV